MRCPPVSVFHAHALPSSGHLSCAALVVLPILQMRFISAPLPLRAQAPLCLPAPSFSLRFHLHWPCPNSQLISRRPFSPTKQSDACRTHQGISPPPVHLRCPPGHWLQTNATPCAHVARSSTLSGALVGQPRSICLGSSHCKRSLSRTTLQAIRPVAPEALNVRRAAADTAWGAEQEAGGAGVVMRVCVTLARPYVCLCLRVSRFLCLLKRLPCMLVPTCKPFLRLCWNACHACFVPLCACLCLLCVHTCTLMRAACARACKQPTESCAALAHDPPLQTADLWDQLAMNSSLPLRTEGHQAPPDGGPPSTAPRQPAPGLPQEASPQPVRAGGLLLAG